MKDCLKHLNESVCMLDWVILTGFISLRQVQIFTAIHFSYSLKVLTDVYVLWLTNYVALKRKNHNYSESGSWDKCRVENEPLHPLSLSVFQTPDILCALNLQPLFASILDEERVREREREREKDKERDWRIVRLFGRKRVLFRAKLLWFIFPPFSRLSLQTTLPLFSSGEYFS